MFGLDEPTRLRVRLTALQGLSMRRRFSVGVALVTVAVVCAVGEDTAQLGCASASAGGAATMRGQLDLTFQVDDPGSAHYTSSNHRLRLELRIGRDGQAALRVRGHVEHRAIFISPNPSSSRPRLSTAEIDDRWVGRATSARGRTKLTLTLVADDAAGRRRTFELSCKRTHEALGDAPRTRRIALQRCMPLTKHTGTPWSDLLPSYARVPLVFALRGDVRIWVSADHQDAKLSAPKAVDPE